MGLSYSFVSTKMYFTALVVNSFKLSIESIRINNLVFTRCIIRHGMAWVQNHTGVSISSLYWKAFSWASHWLPICFDFYQLRTSAYHQSILSAFHLSLEHLVSTFYYYFRNATDVGTIIWKQHSISL